MTPVIAIVGRPNVGKSTLFNRLVGGRPALVDDRPGVTRDRHYGETERWGNRRLVVVDTGGLEPDPHDDLFAQIRKQALAAVEEADLVLWVVDVRAGVTPVDQEVGRLLRTTEKPVLLVANKVDAPSVEPQLAELYELGMEPLHPVSAEHGDGVLDLMDAVLERLPAGEADGEDPVGDPDGGDAAVRIAVIGRPNIGKSTLVNRLLGQERQVVHDMPGTTMDAVDSPFEHEGRAYVLVDTAGVRRPSRIEDHLEGFAVSRAIRTIERCHVTILMVDGAEGVTDQDARLAALVEDRGRALVILVNKWDLVREDPERNVKVVEDELERRLPHATWAPVLYVSALTGKGLHKVMETVDRVYARFNRRLNTAECNKFLEDALREHSPPQLHHHPVRLNYITQVRVRPPTFTIFCNTPDGVQPSYRRYLENRLRRDFDLVGTPIRLHFKEKRRPGEGRKR